MKIKQLASRWAIPLLAVFCAILAVRIISSNSPTEPEVVLSGSPAVAPKANSLIAGAGVVEPSSELVSVATAVSGVIATVHVKVGDVVKRGDLLFTLDSSAASADLRQREANVLVARRQLDESRVQLEERRTSLKIYEAIGDPRAMTQEELQRRTYAVELAKARVLREEANIELAEAAAGLARAELERHSVRSPLDATVLQSRARPGQFAPAAVLSDPLVTLGRTDPMFVRIDVDEADLSRLSIGASATVSPRGDATNRVTAQYVRVDPLVIPKRSLSNSTSERVDTRVLQVVFSLPREARGFFPGQQVDAFVVAEGAQ
jgi:RND family efflux transporter MFP subunit